jgi:hypothetical protein
MTNPTRGKIIIDNVSMGMYLFYRSPMGFEGSPANFLYKIPLGYHQLVYISVFIDDLLFITTATSNDCLDKNLNKNHMYSLVCLNTRCKCSVTDIQNKGNVSASHHWGIDTVTIYMFQCNAKYLQVQMT